MTQPRFDLLPLAKGIAIGLPYHGGVRNGTLTLPNAETMTYPQPADGPDCWVVKNPYLSHAVTATAAETAEGKQWLQYALLSGSARCLGGQQVGTVAQGRCWLYSDTGATWVVSMTYTYNSGTHQGTATLYLDQLFGHFEARGARRTMTRRTLATLTFDTISPPSGLTISGEDVQLGPSPDGSHCFLNCWYRVSGQAFANRRRLYAVVKATITGNGSTAAGSVGSGITGTLSHYKGADDLYDTGYLSTESGTDYSSLTLIWDGANITTNWGSLSGGGDYTSDTEYWDVAKSYAYDTNGAELVVSHYKTGWTEVTASFSATDANPCDWTFSHVSQAKYKDEIRANGTTILTIEADGTTYTCDQSDSYEFAAGGSVVICEANTCRGNLETAPGDQGIDVASGFVWLGETVCYVASDVGSGEWHWLSVYGDVQTQATDPYGKWASYEPMRAEWIVSTTTEDVCWV